MFARTSFLSNISIFYFLQVEGKRIVQNWRFKEWPEGVCHKTLKGRTLRKYDGNHNGNVQYDNTNLPFNY